MKTNKKRNGLVAGLLACTMAASLAWAAGTTPGGLHFFEAGEVIQASLVNENFAAIDAKADANSQAIGALAGLDAETVTNILNILQQFTPEQIEQLVILLTETEIRVTALEEKCIAVVSSITTLESTVANHGTRLTTVEDKTQFMNVDGNTTVFSGTNVQVNNGTGVDGGPANGLGNLILGYNEEAVFIAHYNEAPLRTGSHNLVVGSDNEWAGEGSLVVGILNRMGGSQSTILGCKLTLEGHCRFISHKCKHGRHNHHGHHHKDHDDGDSDSDDDDDDDDDD